MDPFAIARLVIGTGFLSAAAVYDVRSRRVRDPVWVALGSVGLAFFAAELAIGFPLVNDFLFLASAAILFYAVFYGKPLLDEDGLHLRPARLLLFAVAAAAYAGGFLIPVPAVAISVVRTATGQIPGLASVPVLLLVYQGLYQAGLIRGGADAKALMALTLLVPLYPDASPFPLLTLPPTVAASMQTFFPFSLVVFINAAILFLAVPMAYLLVNAVRGDLEFPVALFGTKASLDHLPPHVWLMERVDRRGERVAVLFPSRTKDESEEIAKLRAAGADRVWVQPKVPFLVPLLAGFLLAFFVGNLMLGFLTAVLPLP